MFRWLPAVLFIGFIVWIIVDADLGAQNPFIQFANTIPYGDKIGHACIFGTMAFLVTIASRFASWRLASVEVFYGTSLVFLFALVEEGSQYFMKTRNFDFYDALADFVGICIAALCLRFMQARQQRQASPSN